MPRGPKGEKRPARAWRELCRLTPDSLRWGHKSAA
jgi:hypothetical protein